MRLFLCVLVVCTLAAAQVPPPGGPDVTTMQVYVDNAMKYQVGGSKVNTSLSMSSGKHYVVVKAWDSGGGTWTSSVNINVK